jgi:hypothetical protein
MEGLHSLLERAERDLGREPEAYVAVAVVGRDRREVQVGRCPWSGATAASNLVGRLGAKVATSARGLRVRVHRDGGGLFGSVLMRRPPAGSGEEGRGAPVPHGQGAAGGPDRLATLEAQLARALSALAAQERELGALRSAVAGLTGVGERFDLYEERLVEVEAVVERVREVEVMLAERFRLLDGADEDEG